MASVNDKKDETLVEGLEAIKHEHVQNTDGIEMPPSLAGLSENEYNKLGKKATLKMDLIIMPILVIMYILNYLDRQNIASAKLANIEEDLNLSPVDYQTSVSILFCSYSKYLLDDKKPQDDFFSRLLAMAYWRLISTPSVLFQVPSNMIAGRIKWPGLYICCSMVLWGAISACMAAVQNFGGLLAARVALGAVEAVFFPGALYFLSMFYNRKQFALRAAILYSGSQLGNAFGTLFAIAILELDGAHGIQGWRWVGLIVVFCTL